MLRPEHNLIEQTFWELERRNLSTKDDIRFVVGNQSYLLQQPQGGHFPKLFEVSHSEDPPTLRLNFGTVLQGDLKHLGALRVSPDGAKVAMVGYFQLVGPKLVIIDLKTGEVSPMWDLETPREFEWFNDSQHLIFSRTSPQKSSVTVLSLEGLSEVPLQEEPRASFYFHLQRALSGNVIYIVRRGLLSDAWVAIDANNAIAPLRHITFEKEDTLAHVCDSVAFEIVTRESLLTGTEVTVFAKRDRSEYARIKLNAEESIVGLECFAKAAVFTIQDGWTQKLQVLDFESFRMHAVIAPAEWSTLLPLQQFESTKLMVTEEGPGTPPVHCSLDVKAINLEVACPRIKQIPGIKVEKLEVPSHDGANVPVTVFYRSELRKEGGNPLLLHSYGSYGIAVPTKYESNIQPMLNLGFVYAIANVRGGGGKGFAWAHDGKRVQKINAITDIVAVSEALATRGFLRRDALFGYGRSAGAALLIAAVGREPKLFCGLVLDAPFLNPASVVSNQSELLHTRELLEWGDPTIAAEKEVLHIFNGIDQLEKRPLPPTFLSFSPYDNVVPKIDILSWIALARMKYSHTMELLVYPTGATSHLGSDYHEAENRLQAVILGFLNSRLKPQEAWK